jgi:tetratricopeptide (TPR) repeat protein
MSQFTNTIKAHISANKVKLALEILMDYLKDRDTDLYNQCLMHHSVLVQAEKEYGMGIINRNEASQVLAKVRFGALNIADELQGTPIDEQAACDRAEEITHTFKETEFSVQAVKNSQNWLFLSGGLGLAGVVIFMLFTFFNQKNATSINPTNATHVDTAVLLVSLEKDFNQYSKQKNYEKALVAVNKAIQLRSDQANYYNTRATIYFDTDKIELAAADAERAALLDPNNGFFYATLAQIATKRHNTEAFYRNIELAMRNHLDVWNYTQQIGIVEHLSEKRFETLLNTYKKAFNNSSSN